MLRASVNASSSVVVTWPFGDRDPSRGVSSVRGPSLLLGLVWDRARPLSSSLGIARSCAACCCVHPLAPTTTVTADQCRIAADQLAPTPIRRHIGMPRRLGQSAPATPGIPSPLVRPNKARRKDASRWHVGEVRFPMTLVPVQLPFRRATLVMRRRRRSRSRAAPVQWRLYPNEVPQ